MKAEPLFREKRIVIHRTTGELGTIEIKVWKFPKTSNYPDGRKFSLFLVSNRKVIVGMDNHHPKGPHLHMGETEVVYDYQSDEQLLIDFFDFVRKAGFDL